MSLPLQEDESADKYNNQAMPKFQLRHTPYAGKFGQTDQALFDSKDIATHSQAFDIVSPGSGTGDAMLQLQNPPLLAIRNKTNIQKIGVVTPNIASQKNTINHNRSSSSTSYTQSSLLQKRPLTPLKDPEILSLDVVKKQIEQEKMTIDFKEDPVAYFSKRKDGRGHRFIYLVNRDDPHDPYFSPYDLVKVPFAEIKGDYFTMSATGVTHVFDDGTTETMSLDLWAQEKSIYNSIRKLKLFAQFFFWKPFRIWKNFVMHQRYNELDSAIVYHPFFKNKEFFSLALFLNNNQSKAKDMLHKFLLAFQSQRKFKLAEFIQTNKSNIEHLKVKYEKFINKTMMEVQTLYTTISNPKLVQVHDSDFPDIKRRNPNLAQLMVLEKRKATKRMAKTEAVNRQIMEIGGFIRLADYMLLESLAEGCHDSWKIAETNVASDRSSVFVIDVLYDDDGKVGFSPSLNVLIESIETVLHESLKTLNLLPRLLMQLPLKPFLRDNGLDYVRLFEEGPQFSQVIDRKLLEKAKQHMIEVVKASYHECYEVSQSFSNFYPIYRMGQTWNVSDYLITPNGKRFKGTLNYDLSVDVINDDFLLNPEDQPIVDFQRITDDINKFREDRKRVENMRNGAARGALFIDSKGLKANLAPILEKSMSDLQELLDKLASLKIDKLRCALQFYSQKLKQEPQTLDDYVSFCELIERCQKTTPQIEKENEFIDKLFELFDKFEFNHDENPNHNLFNVFTNDKTAAQTKKVDQLGIFTEAIKSLIAEIERKITKYFDKATTIPQTMKDIDIDLCLLNSKKLCVKIDGLKPKVDEAIRQQKIMEVSFNNFERYESLKITAKFSVKLYEAVNRWLELSVTMTKIPFKEINVEQFKKDIQSLKDQAEKLKEESPKEIEYPLLDQLLSKIDEIAPYVKQLEQLSHGKMQLRHWNQLFECCNHKGEYHEEITIDDLSKFKILRARDEIDQITATSQGESQLEAEFASIMKHWETVQMPLAETQIKIEETLLLGPTGPLLLEIQDTLVTLSKMSSLPYVQGIREDVTNLSSTLENLSLIIEKWQLFQGNWIVLSALFSNAEAKNILPNQASSFTNVQKKWSLIAHHTLKDTRLLHVCTYPNLSDILKENNKTMESILVSLGKYLDVKRQSSPRLFFLGNSEVLTLVTTSNAASLTSILTKIFMHVAKIDCHENDGAENEAAFEGSNFQRLKIFGLIGEDGDSIQFPRHIQFNSSFESLINQIIDSMKTTVKDAISSAIPGCQSGSFVDWIMTTPTYVAFIALNIVFCNEMEDCFATYESNPRAFQQYESIMKRRIEDTTDSFLMPLSPRDKLKLNTILTELLGFRDRFRAATEKIQNHSPYLEWLNSLRFRFLPNSASVQVEFSDLKIDFGYEYWGKTPILIHTPTIDACLSDCIYSLSQNQLPMITGSAAAAKQVIGKTLACLFGQFAYIIRPFPDMSEYFLSKILTGVVSTGALAIFSGIEQLSEKSLCYLFDNAHSIISANEAGASRITISSRLSDLNKNCRILFTADSNFVSYGNIPPQLKVFARPISLLSPSYSKIIDIYMTSVGFRETKVIVPKFSNFIQSISSIFSTFLPNISLASRILKICTTAKDMTKHGEKGFTEEMSIAYNSFKFLAPLCDVAHVDLLKKILFNSFQIGGNVDDMFEKINKVLKEETSEKQLIEAIKKEIESLNIDVDSDYLTKQTFTLYNMMKQQSCVVIVGPPNSGKSTIVEVLKNCFNQQEILSLFPDEKKIQVLSLFHMSDKRQRIYGDVYDDPSIGTIYSYGQIQSAIHRIVENYNDSHQILKLDGKVTKSFSSFISEFFGSSQSEKLMLNSLETFHYSPNFNLIIETDDLSNATPSLLAKAGILVMRNLQSEIPYNQLSPPCVLGNPMIPFSRAAKRCSNFVDEESIQSIRSVFVEISPAIVSKVYHMNNLVCSTENNCSTRIENGNILLGEVLPYYVAVLALTGMNEAGIDKSNEEQIRLCLIVSFAKIYCSVLHPRQVIPFTTWLCSEYHIEMPKDWVGFTVSPNFSAFYDRPQLFSIRLNQGKMIPLSSGDLEKPPVFTNSSVNNEKNLPLFVDELNVIHTQILPALQITKLMLLSDQNIIIHGPMDSGKTSFLSILFSEMKNIEPIIINAPCYLTGESIVNYLLNHTTLVSKAGNHSHVDSKKYVLVFDGVESSNIELIEFIRMLISTYTIPRFSPNDQKVFEFDKLRHFSVIVTTRNYNELPTRFLTLFAPVVLSSINETTASFIGNKILQTYGFSNELSEALMTASMMIVTQFPNMSIIHNIISICSTLCFIDKSSLNETTSALLSELYYTCLHRYQLEDYKEKVTSTLSEHFKDQVENINSFLLFDPLVYPSFEPSMNKIKVEIKPHTIQSLQEELNYYLTVHNTNSIEKISMKFSSVAVREWSLLYQTLSRPGHNAFLFGKESSGRYIFSRFVSHQIESEFICFNNPTAEEILCEKERIKSISNTLKDCIIKAINDKKNSVIYINATNDNEKEVRLIADLATKLIYQPFFTETELDELYEKAVQPSPKPISSFERKQANLSVINILRNHLHFLIRVSSDLNYKLEYNGFDSIEFNSDVQENYDSVVSVMLKSEEMKEIVENDADDISKLPLLLPRIASIARKFIPTSYCPNKFYDFIDSFQHFVRKDFKEIQSKKKNISSALKFFKRMEEESVKVNKDLENLAPNLKKLQKESEMLQTSYNTRKEAIEVRKKKLEQESIEKKAEVEELIKAYNEHEQERSNLNIVAEQTTKDVEKLSDNDIETIRITAADPQPSLKLLLEMFCVFLELPVSYEKSGQKLLMGPMFVPTITAKITARTITPNLLEDAQVYIKDPKLNEKQLESIAPALSVLYRWITSLCKLAKVMHDLNEEKNHLDEKQRLLNKFNEDMNVELPSIQQVEKTLEKESQTLAESNNSLLKMEEEYKKIDQRKKSIDMIFKQINQITNKWENESNDYHQTFSKLIGDSIILAFYIAFCGPMKSYHKKESLEEVMELIRTNGIITSSNNPIQSIKDRFFVDSTNTNNSTNSNMNATFNLNTSFNMNSTLNDQFMNNFLSAKSSSSSQNAQPSFSSTMNVSTNSTANNNASQFGAASWSAFDPCQVEVQHLISSIRTPLIIDPDGVVVNLFSSTVKAKKLITVSQSVSNLEQIIQSAISDGKILVLLDCNHLHPLVSSILSLLNFVPPNKNVSLNIRVGSKLVTWDKNFKLVLVSSLTKLEEIPMDLSSRVTIIDASETSLQSTESSFERQFIEFFEPELAPKIIEMKQTEALHNVQVQKCENDTLNLISDIIETMESNDEYDCLDDETIINDLIKLKDSLIRAMTIKHDFSSTKNQVKSIIEPFQSHIKLCQIFWKVISRDLINVNQSAFFSFNSYLKMILGVISNSGINPGSLTDEQHKALSNSIINSTFQFLFQSLPINDCLFFMFIAAFMMKEEPNLSDLNDIIDHISSEMDKNVDFSEQNQNQNQNQNEENAASFELIKSSNSLSLFENILSLLNNSFGEEYQSFVPFFQFDSIVANNAATPTIVLCDSKQLINPTTLIQHFASPKNRHENLSVISMCDDIEMIKNARRLIQSAQGRGNWVVVHYSRPSRVSASMLSDVFNVMNASPNINANFRLIVIASTTDFLPRNMLNKSKKFPAESYPSIKNNMLSLFQHFSSSIRSTTNPRAMKILSYVCALLLSSLSFRNFLTPLGFTSFFRLNDLSFKDTIEQLRVIIDAHPNDAPLRNLRGQIDQLICAAIGEVHDRRTIQAHTAQMIRQATLDDGFSVASKSAEKEIWKVPNGETPLASFTQIIQKIPLFTSTEVLHMNAKFLLNWNMSIWAAEPFIKYRKGSSSGSLKGSSKGSNSISFDFKSAMMKVDNFVMLLPNEISIADEELKKKAMCSLGLFLLKEVEQLNFIIRFLKEELVLLTHQFMKGIATKTGLSFTEGKVPQNWAKATKIWNFNSVNSFASHVIERHAQLTRCLQEQNPTTFDMRLVEHPDSLIRSFILDAAISENQTLDSICLQFSIVFEDKNESSLSEKGKFLYLNNVCLANADYTHDIDPSFYDDDNVDGELIIRKSGKKTIPIAPFKMVTSLVAKVVSVASKPTKVFNVPLYKNAVIRSMYVENEVTDIENGESNNFMWNIPLPSSAPEIDMQQNGATLFCRMPEQFI